MEQKYTTTLKIVETILSSHRLSGELVTQVKHIPTLSGVCDVKITVEKGNIVFCSIHNSTSYISGQDALKFIYSKGKLDWTLTSVFSASAEKKDASRISPQTDPEQPSYSNPMRSVPHPRQPSLGNSNPAQQYGPNPQPYYNENHHPANQYGPNPQPYYNENSRLPHRLTPRPQPYRDENGRSSNSFTPSPEQAPFYHKEHRSSPNQSSPEQTHISSYLHELLSNDQFTGAQTDPYAAIPLLSTQAFVIYETTIIQKNPLQQPPANVMQSWPRWQRQIFLTFDGKRTIQQVIDLVAKNQPERAIQAIKEMLSSGYITIL